MIDSQIFDLSRRVFVPFYYSITYGIIAAALSKAAALPHWERIGFDKDNPWVCESLATSLSLHNL